MSTTGSGTDLSEDIRNDVARIKRLLGLDVNRLAIGQEIEGIVTGGPFGNADYTITGVNLIDFVNVSTSIGPAQGSSGAPAQVTGLTVTPQAGSNTQLNLAWTAAPSADFNYYNVYRGTTSGFIVGDSSRIVQPVTNSYNNTGLSPGTIYYYRVSTTNDAELEGTASSQVSAATTGRAPDFLLHLDGNFVDSSINAVGPSFLSAGNGYLSPGQFGSGAWKCNSPISAPGGNNDRAEYDPIPTSLQMDTTTGFSFSLWIYPTDISAQTQRRVIIDHGKDASNMFSIQLKSDGTLYFFVKKAGVDYKAEKTGFIINSWQHIGAIFNSTTNAISLYRNAVIGSSSTQTPEYPTHTDELEFGVRTGTAINVSQYEGYMDEIQYFKGYVLSSTQVTNLMNTNSV